MKRTRVLLVEDDPATLTSLAAKISDNSHLNLVAAVGTCAAANAYLGEHSVDVLLTDLDLPDGDGTSIILHGCACQPELLAMVISVFGDEKHVIRAIQAGASGYLLKDGSAGELGRSIMELLEGLSPISPAIAHHLINALQPVQPSDEPKPEFALSDREIEVLTLASKGYTYQEIADLLDISINTVSTYTRRVYNKLAVSSRSEAVYEAAKLGLMKP